MDATAVSAQESRRSTAAVRLVAPFLMAWLLSVGAYVVLSVTPHSGLLEVARQAAFLVPFWGASITSALVARRSAGVERRILGALAIAIAAVTVSETYVSGLVLSGRALEEGWPVLPEVLTVSAALVMIAALTRSVDMRAYSRLAAARHAVDAIAVGLASTAVVLGLFVAPMIDAQGSLTAGQAVPAAAYSGLGVVLLTTVGAAFGARILANDESWFQRVLAGLWVYALATAAWPAWLYGTLVRPTSAWDTLVESMWATGMWLAFAGMARRLAESGRSGDEATPVPRTAPRSHGALSAAVPVLLTFACGYALAAGVGPLVVPDLRPTMLVAGILLALLLVVRQVLAGIENKRLALALSTDPVTGLHAYRPFQDALQTELDIAERTNGSVALVMFDIDGFRRLNDACGHTAGDQLLKQAADAIARCVRSSDSIGRLGGDEFAVIMGGASAEHAQRFALRALAEVRTVCDDVTGNPLQATAGIAVYPLHAATRAELLRCAAGALFWAKRHDRGGFAVYDPSVVTSLDAKDEIERLEVETQVRAIRALAVAVDARDPATQFHSKNVALLVTELAYELGLPHEHVRRLEIAALLHDVGKIGVSDRVLRKRSPLTAAEVMHVREHSVLGERIMRSSGFDDVALWVRHHHERYDGSGYPDGLAAERIPYEARLLAVCDAYDAMTSERPYRSAMSPAAALQEIDCCIGSQFDPEVAEAFIALMGRRLPL